MSETISTLMTMSRNPQGSQDTVRVGDAVAASVGVVHDHGELSAVNVHLDDDVADLMVGAPEAAVVRIVAPVQDRMPRPPPTCSPPGHMRLTALAHAAALGRGIGLR